MCACGHAAAAYALPPHDGDARDAPAVYIIRDDVGGAVAWVWALVDVLPHCNGACSCVFASDESCNKNSDAWQQYTSDQRGMKTAMMCLILLHASSRTHVIAHTHRKRARVIMAPPRHAR